MSAISEKSNLSLYRPIVGKHFQNVEKWKEKSYVHLDILCSHSSFRFCVPCKKINVDASTWLFMGHYLSFYRGHIKYFFSKNLRANIISGSTHEFIYNFLYFNFFIIGIYRLESQASPPLQYTTLWVRLAFPSKKNRRTCSMARKIPKETILSLVLLVYTREDKSSSWERSHLATEDVGFHYSGERRIYETFY
jgi:hypothetical protein